MEGIVNFMSYIVTSIGQAILSFLPRSPFRDWIDSFDPGEFVGFLNWFLPIRQFLIIVAVWLAAISLFYLYSIIMRWVKMIGD